MKAPKVFVGLIVGTIAGIVDVIPMLMQGLSWDANLSAFSFWVISGVMIATSNLKMRGALKGIVISALVLIPAAVLIGWSNPMNLVPIGIMTLVLGGVSGYLIERFGE